jgi:predicted TIM-barrel fold metal-dependent hydrolase
MIIDTHIHVWGYPVFEEHADKIKTAEDLMLFRTRYPELYARRLTEKPVDNSDTLVRQMDRHGIGIGIVQATPGEVTNDQVAQSVARHPNRLVGLARIGQDQISGDYLEDPSPVRRGAPEQIRYCIEELGMRGLGEIFPRALTREIHPELIAADFKPIMDVLSQFEVPIQFPTAWAQFPGGLYYGNPIWVDEIAGRYRSVPIILTKMGRGMQYYFDASMVVAMRNQNVYFDVPGTTAAHLRRALDTIGSKRILFGTDWSGTWRLVTKPADIYAKTFSVLDEANLTSDERDDILWRNAARLFRLDAPAK